MTGISRHLIVFLYIITFFSGVSCFTMVALMADKGAKIFGNRYVSLRRFIAALFIFLIVNFMMFYREYFFLNNQMNIVILFFFDVFLVTISYYWIEFNRIQELDKWLPFIRVIGCAYPPVWLAVYIFRAAFPEGRFALLRGCLALSADAIFCFLIVGCAIYSAWHHIQKNNDVRERNYFTALNISISLYLLYMYFTDLITILAEFRNVKLGIHDFYFLDPVIFLFLVVNIDTMIFMLQKIKEIGISADGAPDKKAEIIMSCCLARVKEFHHLTQRETEMIELVHHGMSNPQISERLNISNYTVKRHMNNIFKKMNIKSRFELIRLIEEEKNEVSGIRGNPS